MAKPIKQTPVLKGEDAKRFLADINTPKPISKKEKTSQEETFNYFKSISSFNW